MKMSQYVEGSVWFYAPSKIAPVVFIFLFFLSGALHAWQTMFVSTNYHETSRVVLIYDSKYKSWRTTVVLPWAAALMITGFITREIGAYNYKNLPLAIASNVLILSGPPVYALINYLILSRLLFYIPYLSPLHPGRVVTTFVGLDVMVEIMLAQGAWRSIHSGLSEHERKIGENLVRASLLLQVVLFILFTCLIGYFHHRTVCAKLYTKRIRTIVYVLYASTVIITTRCVYRIVEYFQGWNGTIFRTEPYFWVFEASLMLINTVMLNIWFPGKRLPRSNSCFLARDGVTERRGPGWADDRPWIVSTFDPLDICRLITGRKHVQFWDMSQEELDALRTRKKANKRPWYALVFDPFHLWGTRGYFGRHFGGSQRISDPHEDIHLSTNPMKTERV